LLGERSAAQKTERAAGMQFAVAHVIPSDQSAEALAKEEVEEYRGISFR
jgi:hypothetical protein